MSEFNTFEEYKLFIEDTSKMTDRRQLLTSTYVTVNSIILASIGFILKDYKQEIQVIVFVLVCSLVLAGILMSLLWNNLILKYKKLIQLRMKHLRAMENSSGMKGSIRMYHLEDELYPPEDKEDHPKKSQGFSVQETKLPMYFIAIYIIFIICFIISQSVKLI